MVKEARHKIIWRHVRELITRTSVSWPTLAMEVREHHERLVPPEQRLIQLSNHKDAYTRARLDAQTLRRMDAEADHALSDYDLPVVMEDAIVLALKTLKYTGYEDLEAELAALRGRLSVAIPNSHGVSCLRIGSAVMRETADALDAIADLEANGGRIDATDCTHKLQRAEVEVAQAMAALAAAHQQINQALAEQQKGTA